MSRKKKEPRSQYDQLNASDLKKIPPGVYCPPNGLRWTEVDGYVGLYREFRDNILAGNTYGNGLHSLRSIAKSKGRALVVLDDDFTDEEEYEEARVQFLTGQKYLSSAEFVPRAGGFIVFDEAFALKAWNIGVFRFGWEWLKTHDDETDIVIQRAVWGFQNQG